MKQQAMPYQKQIFVCTNNKEGKEPSCGDHKGEDVFRELRKIAKEKGIHPRIRVAQAKCLGQCSVGVNVMVYPENIWYSSVSMDDVQDIVKKHF